MNKKRRFTLMLVPHSGKAIASIEVGFIFMVCISVLVVGVSVGLGVFSYKYTTLRTQVSKNIAYFEKEDARIKNISDSLQVTSDVSLEFSAELDKTVEYLNIPNYDSIQKNEQRGDFSQLLYSSDNEFADGDSLDPLLNVSQQLEKNIPMLKSINKSLAQEKSLMQDLPVYWPVPGAVVSMEWGPNIHPIFGSWYIHKGMDLAAMPGTPVYSAAEGVVTKTEYDPGYGLHIYVSHKYGFKTHYSHLSAIKVKKGQKIKQGQRIGSVGATGLATGPHLDFQVYLGNELVDPGVYLRTFHNYSRPNGNR